MYRYIIEVSFPASAYETGELAKMFLPREEFEIKERDEREAPDLGRSFSVLRVEEEEYEKIVDDIETAGIFSGTGETLENGEIDEKLPDLNSKAETGITTSDFISSEEKNFSHGQNQDGNLPGNMIDITPAASDYIYSGSVKENERKKVWKNTVKRGVYTALSRELGKSLPWGILTGVKPVKIVRELEDRGLTESEIGQYMREYYLVSQEKTDLLLEILRIQRPYNSKKYELHDNSGSEMAARVPEADRMGLVKDVGHAGRILENAMENEGERSELISPYEAGQKYHVSVNKAEHSGQVLQYDGEQAGQVLSYDAEHEPGIQGHVSESEVQRAKNGFSEKAGIYLGIPFCPTRCVYCSFTSNVAKPGEIDRYLEALYSEIDYVSESMKRAGKKIETFYIGGGTPTTLDERQLEGLLTKIFTSFDLEGLAEFTVEAGRPDTINREKLEIIKSHGIGRISVNPQSMNKKTLEAIGRRHDPEDIVRAYETARSAGIDRINMDLIAGLPGESPEDFRRTLDLVSEMDPENITVHTLALKRASKLREEDRDYNYREAARLSRMVEDSFILLREKGYRPYYLYRQKYMAGNFENLGWAKPGTECVFNIRTMDERQDTVALGAGGISKRFFSGENRIERAANVSNYEIYIDRLEEMKDRKGRLFEWV